MTQEFVVGLGKEALWTSIMVGAPILGIMLVIGVVISALQAVTQINEASLAFVPKALASAVALAFFGPWMLNQVVAFAAMIFSSLPSVAK